MFFLFYRQIPAVLHEASRLLAEATTCGALRHIDESLLCMPAKILLEVSTKTVRPKGVASPVTCHNSWDSLGLTSRLPGAPEPIDCLERNPHPETWFFSPFWSPCRTLPKRWRFLERPGVVLSFTKRFLNLFDVTRCCHPECCNAIRVKDHIM